MKPLLLVDGYNVIGAWDVPRAEHLSIDEARERLVHLVADYAGYSGEEVIVVFDGHYTDRPVRSRSTVHGVEVVFTKHAESADNYIETLCAEAPKWRHIRVATSDSTEQTVTMGRGAVRISSREFLIELTQVRSVGRVHMKEEKVSRGDIFSRLPPHQREIFDRMRKGLDEEDEKPKRPAVKKPETQKPAASQAAASKGAANKPAANRPAAKKPDIHSKKPESRKEKPFPTGKTAGCRRDG